MVALPGRTAGTCRMTGYGAGIFRNHADMLRASAIGEDVAAERQYVSVDTKRRLDSAGFKHYQQRTPGLLIPVHDTSGAVALWQYRPDSPRVNGQGKPVKYETPGGSRMVLDVPPRVRAQLPDPKVPLWVTEGVKKADAAVSAGLPAAVPAFPAAWLRHRGVRPDWVAAA